MKIWKKKLPKLSLVWREGGRKEEKSLTNKQTKKENFKKQGKQLNKQTKIVEKWRKTGVFFRFLEIGTISFELGEIGERYARRNE